MCWGLVGGWRGVVWGGCGAGGVKRGWAAGRREAGGRSATSKPLPGRPPRWFVRRKHPTRCKHLHGPPSLVFQTPPGTLLTRRPSTHLPQTAAGSAACGRAHRCHRLLPRTLAPLPHLPARQLCRGGSRGRHHYGLCSACRLSRRRPHLPASRLCIGTVAQGGQWVRASWEGQGQRQELGLRWSRRHQHGLCSANRPRRRWPQQSRACERLWRHWRRQARAQALAGRQAALCAAGEQHPPPHVNGGPRGLRPSLLVLQAPPLRRGTRLSAHACCMQASVRCCRGVLRCLPLCLPRCLPGWAVHRDTASLGRLQGSIKRCLPALGSASCPWTACSLPAEQRRGTWVAALPALGQEVQQA